MAAGAVLIWQAMDDIERAAVLRVVVSEADRQLERTAPSGLFIDTKAEENAWDAEVLAAALTLAADHHSAPGWHAKFIEFSANTFSAPQDRWDRKSIDDKPVCERVFTANVHCDFTLENHGSYHFCYVASPLQSIALARFLLSRGGTLLPDSQLHHVADVWNAAKHLFLGDRFAYVGGKDWARYAYGLYFIIPALVMLPHELNDPDARAIELIRLHTLCTEQDDNPRGGFFEERVSRGCYVGQQVKYETDCFACLALGYLLHKSYGAAIHPTPLPELQRKLVGSHVSPECVFAYARSERAFFSFCWTTLTIPYPLALFVPLGHDDLAEWAASNLLGQVRLFTPPTAVSIRNMRAISDGLRISGVIAYRDRRGRTLYEHHLKLAAASDVSSLEVRSCFVARQSLFVRFAEGLSLYIPNDRFNGYRRRIVSDLGSRDIHFKPSDVGSPPDSRARRLYVRLKQELGWDDKAERVVSRWLNLDDQIGIVLLDEQSSCLWLRQESGRNAGGTSLHRNILTSNRPRRLFRTRPGETIIQTHVRLYVGAVVRSRDYVR